MADDGSLTMIITFLPKVAPLLIKGASMTIIIWISSTVISLCFGMLVGIARSNAMRTRSIATMLDGITFVLRGIPYYVQLLIAYFVLPYLMGINVSALSAGIVSLGLCSAAYVSQIIRGALNALPEGQWEACTVLGYSRSQALLYVMLPQVLRNALPVFTSELDQLLKSTSIISSIGVLELTRAGMNIIAREMNPTAVYLIIACMYLAASWGLALASRFVEKKVFYVVK